MLIEPPISVADFYRGLKVAYPELAENVPMKHDKPRVSGIVGEAREVAYYMANTPRTNEGSGQSRFTQEQGRLAEAISIAALEGLGLKVINTGREQVELPDSYPLSGHPDGEILGLGERGERWGFENKHYGAYAYELMLRNELDPDIIAQGALYGDAMGYDKILVCVTSQDASTIRRDMARNRKNKTKSSIWATDDMDPKLQMYAIDVHEAQFSFVPMLLQRAQWFTSIMKTHQPQDIHWEDDPTDEDAPFPWPYSDWQDQARKDPPGTLWAPPLPWKG